LQQKTRQLRKDIQNAERKINRLEESLTEYETIIADGAQYGSPAYQTAMEKHREIKQKLEVQMEKWEKAEETLEGLTP
jgi:ATP-binding cassette subfamily F protein 3